MGSIDCEIEIGFDMTTAAAAAAKAQDLIDNCAQSQTHSFDFNDDKSFLNESP